MTTGPAARTIENLRLERIHLGRPLAETVVAEAGRRGAQRVCIVTSGSLSRNTSVIDVLAAALGDRCVDRFDDTTEHVPRSTVIRLADRLRACNADLVVTIGGGTPVDTVKMALVCLAEQITSTDQLEAFAISVDDNGKRVTPSIGSPPCRQIAAPTTLSGAEFSDLSGCVDPDRQLKQLFSGPEIGPAAVILDPAITIHTPTALWLSTGVRALDHAVETLCSTSPEAFADAGAIEAIGLLRGALPRTVADPADLDARLDSQIGVWQACMGLNRVPYGASHGIGHQLGAVAGVPHGYTSCIMLPHVMAYNEPVTAERQQRIAVALGRPDQPASESMRELIASLGMPPRLRDVGVEPHHFDAIANGSLANAWVRANARPITSADQLIEILERAY